jgi:superfamily II DNA or RNA helicase
MAFNSARLTLHSTGLRAAQPGALHAKVAHQSMSDEPAQVVLAAGVGKTLIAVLAPYLLEATRVLVYASRQPRSALILKHNYPWPPIRALRSRRSGRSSPPSGT